MKWTYDTTPQSYSMSITDRGNTTNYDFWVETDNPVEKDEYGYGQGAPGALMRKTEYSYFNVNPVNNVNYQQLPIYIINTLQGKEVYDGSGNEVADTTYQYDNYATPIVASGAVQHGTSLQSYGTSYTTRGNVTSSTEVANSSGGTLTTYNYEFDDAGNILEKKDSDGNIKTFSYSDSWGNSVCAPSSGNAAAYVSSVTSPLGEKTQYTWNSCAGTMASVTDTNNQPTTFAYDIMDRRVEASYPNGGQTCIQYSDAPNSNCSSISSSSLPIQISTTQKIDSSTSATSTVKLDGLARQTQEQLSSGYDVVTTYDADGNVASTSYNGDLTQYQYDALGRKVIQTQPDGSSTQWCYDGVKVNSSQSICSAGLGNTSIIGSTVDHSDETGRRWQYTDDAFGQLVKVVSPDPANAVTAAPADDTDYTYDPVGDLTDVDQWNGAYNTAPDMHRSFVYDMLGRLTSSTNPETGTTNYSYTSSGALCSGNPSDVCSRTDADNVTTTYSYDQDGNLIEKSYSDTTPAAFFDYQHGSGSSEYNTNGRIIEEYTGSSTSPDTEVSNIQYNQTGQITNETQCVKGTCTASGTLADTYNLAGDVSSWTNGASNPGILLTANYDTADRLKSLTSSWSDASHPDTLFKADSSVGGVSPYGPYGLTAAQIGYTSSTENAAISLIRTYDDRGRLTSTTDTGIVLSSSAGNGSVQILGSEQSKGTATGATGSVAIGTSTGGEQSEQTTAATNSTGAISVSGSEQSSTTPGASAVGSVVIAGTERETTYSSPGCHQRSCSTTVWDTGTVTVTVGGVSESVGYGEGSSSSSIASALATAFSGSTLVAASVSGSAISFTAKSNGTSGDYSLNTSVNYNGTYFSSASFSATPSGSAMTGGANPVTTYDGGTFTATLNGCSGSYNWGQPDTSSSIANGLASALNGSCGSLVSAAASGAGISLTSKSTGTGVNWPVSVSTTHNSAFSSSSFAGAASGMSGGKAAITTYDSGTLTVSLDGTNTSVPYSQGDTTTTIAQKLESALSSSSLVSVSLSGTTINLSTKQKGASTNYPLSASVSYNSSVFSQASFTATASGSALSGGSDANGTPVYDRGSVTLTINGTAETVNYGQNDTSASVAGNLASAFSGNSQVTVSASSTTLTIAAKSAGASTDYIFSSSETYDTGDGFSAPSFTVSPSSGALSGGTTDGVSNPAVVYSFNVPSGGYAANGNLLQVSDSVTGNWTYSYDPLNRLLTAASSSGYFSGLNLTWTYDNFGNRESQTAPGSSNVSLTQPESLTFSAGNNRADQFQYYANGDVKQDLQNTYLYDAEGRVCAVDSTLGGVTLYLYNANGTRVAKGSGSFSCNPSANGFTVTHWYILDLAGRQMTEYDGSGNWLHSNVFANGQLLATYSSSGTALSFALNDWLGTKRVQAKADGEFDMSFVSLPYGDQMVSGTGATEQFFTGKERDTESGNDYFGARYYSNAFGRWLSPDWSAKEEPIPYAKLDDPQSLNLYDYLGDNPTSAFDADGHAPGGTTGAEDCALGAVTACVPQTSQLPSQAQQQMTTSAAGVAFIKSWEGWNGTYDKATGKWLPKDDGFGNGTIGWGHNCGKCADFAGGITKAEGDALLTKDLGRFESAVNGLGANLSQQQFDGLVDFAFNVRNFGGSTLFSNVASGAAVTEGNFTAYGNGRVNGQLVAVPGLIRRREAEYDLYANGVYGYNQ